MIWVYALIGLAVGLIIGALAVRLGSSKFREQEAMKRDLEKNKAELEEYRKELVSHFARRIIWRKITASYISTWRKVPQN